jgi:hypothetical protein
VVKVIKFAQDVTKEKIRMIDFECQIEGIRATQVVVTFTPDGKWGRKREPCAWFLMGLVIFFTE